MPGDGKGQGERQGEYSPPTPPPGDDAVAVDLDTEFERWWLLMPKRGEHANPKKPAKARWMALVKSKTVTIDTLRAGARGYAAAMLKTGAEPRGIAQAITWLNQARWEQYAPAAGDSAGTTAAADGAGIVNVELCRRWVAKWQAGERWPKFLGPAPGEPGCRVPTELLPPPKKPPPPTPPPEQPNMDL
jgi:hypothetical protein